MKKIIILTLMLFANTIYSQITLIPDSQFESYLIIVGIDSDGIVNGQVLTSDIDQITSFGLIGNPSITDLTGIEDFASLESLLVFSVNITELNLSENLNLKSLEIADVSLEYLDLSNNLMLEELTISLNFSGGFFTSPITYIDLSSNLQLGNVFIGGAFITHIDISNNINIYRIDLTHMDDLTFVNLKNDNNQNLIWVRLLDNENLQCVQVDDPQAVIAGTDPPYDNWVIENNPVITDDCNLGIEEYLTSKIRLYPNPVKDVLFIKNNDNIEFKKIIVYDILGKAVLIEKNNFDQMDLSSIMSGILFIKIETENGILTKKIIKE
ncbi:MAG: hypothetical protein ACJA2M_002624 [Polaribacter sp.]|jgi:hypothetical protein|tara:strand:- start:2809 stop:3780 length:972 start_codon:yes stop_codon:yes gene_type:complete